MAYVTNQNLKLSHIDALITLCGFTIVPSDTNAIRSVQTDNGQIINFTNLPAARDYLVHELQIRQTMAQLTSIV